MPGEPAGAKVSDALAPVRGIDVGYHAVHFGVSGEEHQEVDGY